MTRQNIAYATNKLTQFMLNSTSTHMHALKRIVRYLTHTANLDVCFQPNEQDESELVDYIDFSYDDDDAIEKSHSNYIFML